MPRKYRWYGQLWQELNPDITIKDWSWQNLPEDLPCQDVMEDLRRRCTTGTSTELPTQLADILGYYLSWSGGIYANADIRPVLPIPEEMWGIDFATFEEYNYPLVVNAFTGGTTDSLFWKFVLEGVSENYFSYPTGSEMVFTTGPQYLTKKINEWSSTTAIKIYPYQTVNPILWKDVPVGKAGSDVLDLNRLPEGCLGVHDWGHKLNGRTNIVS